MGDLSGGGQQDEYPVRQVTVPGFWIMETEVTVDMYRRYIEATGTLTGPPCWVYEGDWVPRHDLNWRQPGFKQHGSHPVTCMNWHDATGFARWLTEATTVRFALPSEAQWEYAARAGQSARYINATDRANLCRYANGADSAALLDYPDFDVNDCADGFTRTSPAGTYLPNAWGLYDMSGNVWEWTRDCWHTSYEAAPQDGSAKDTGNCKRRAYRGGAYGDVPYFLRLSLRNRGDVDQRRDDVGFRLVVNGSDTPLAAPLPAPP